MHCILPSYFFLHSTHALHIVGLVATLNMMNAFISMLMLHGHFSLAILCKCGV